MGNATTITELPVTLFGATISLAVFPAMSQHYASGQVDEYKKDSSVGYIDKLKAIKLVLKAWVMAALGDDKEMETLVKKAYLLASRYDKASKKNDLSGDFKFYYTEEKAYFFDSTGITAVAGMDNLFEELKEYPSKKLVKFLPKVIECWRKEIK